MILVTEIYKIRPFLRGILRPSPDITSSYPAEKRFLLEHIVSLPKETQVLNYGCGKGRILDMIGDRVSVTGVDINKSYVERATSKGFDCMSMDEFNKTDKRFNVIIISHVIEHLQCTVLYSLISSIMGRLSDNGKLIIFSPVPCRDFYDMFDHVKPYTPKCFEELFEQGGRPIQFERVGCLQRVCLNYGYTSRYVKYFISKNLLERFVVVLVNKIYFLGHLISPRVFSVPTSWMAVYEKTG